MYKFIRQITPLLLLLASLAMSANNSYRFIHITGNEEVPTSGIGIVAVIMADGSSICRKIVFHK